MQNLNLGVYTKYSKDSQKRVPCFVHCGCKPGLYPEEYFVVIASIHSATPTNFIAGPLVASSSWWY